MQNGRSRKYEPGTITEGESAVITNQEIGAMCLSYFAKFGFEPDPWQRQVFEQFPTRLLLNCSRQAGKSTTAAIIALLMALARPLSKVLLLSRTYRLHYERVAEEESKFEAMHNTLLGNTVVENAEISIIQVDPELPIKSPKRRRKQL